MAVLDRRITVRRKTVVNGPLGATETWTSLGTFWAGRSDLSDSEKVAAGTVMALVSARFVVNSTTATRGIRPADVLQEGGLVFEIVGIKESGRHAYLEITAEARLDR